MKGFWILILGVLMHWASLEAPAMAYHDRDSFSGVQNHHSFEMVAQSKIWGATDSEVETEQLKKIYGPGFSAFTANVNSPAAGFSATYTGQARTVAVPLRYRLCVLRL